MREICMFVRILPVIGPGYVIASLWTFGQESTFLSLIISWGRSCDSAALQKFGVILLGGRYLLLWSRSVAWFLCSPNSGFGSSSCRPLGNSKDSSSHCREALLRPCSVSAGCQYHCLLSPILALVIGVFALTCPSSPPWLRRWGALGWGCRPPSATGLLIFSLIWILCDG